MNTLTALLLTTNLLLALSLCAGWWRLRSTVAGLRTSMASTPAAAPTPMLQMARDATPVLSIHILNPVELALNKHWAAGALGRLTPTLLRGIVARESARIARDELERHGARAEVRVVSRG